jgi:tRNA (guanine-N(7)-)-methyltransferase subunit TRM82
MADEGIREDIHDPEVEHDPNTLHDLGAERDENERFQTYAQTRLYPPGHIRLNTHQAFAETMEQPPVSIKTGFQSTASTGHVLFAANGPDIHSFDILENKHLSTWKWPKEKNFPEIPEALTSVHDPNLPGWALQVDETIELKPAKKSGKKSGKKETGKTAAGKTDAGDKDAANAGKSAKRRKLNNTEPELTVLDGETEVEKPDENGTDVNTKDGFAGDLDTEELDPVPARPTNPATWHSGIVKGDADNSGENSDGTDIKNTKYEKTSTRPPDEKPEGWTPDQLENWRRPEFRPERRLLWKHQASTATPDIPMVQCMSVTADGKHVVAVTGSDKTIWVFEHDGNGKLTLLSQRCVICSASH